MRGEARVANVRRGSGFRARGVARRVLADAWLDDARMEHASIASFARFVLQLLALGAPADLVSAAIAAAADEVEHARLCFAVAAKLDGVASAPAALAIDGALETQTIGAIVAQVVVEGCIGETLSAWVAARQLELATDETARAALIRIVEDEARHAELAWRFVRWAIDTFGEEARTPARHAMQYRAAQRGEEPIDESVWHAFGRLTPTEHATAKEQAWNEVVLLCARTALRPAIVALGPPAKASGAMTPQATKRPDLISRR